MKTGIKLLPLVISLCALTFGHLEANAQSYSPVGPQTNVPVSTVINGGWTECYRDTYDNNMGDFSEVLAACEGSLLMLSCRPTGSSTLTLLAQGNRSDVTFDTGVNETEVHIANGVGWYFNDTWSWGFVRAGDIVDKDECDTDDSGAADERLCWHADNGGYRCGTTEGLNTVESGGENYERIVYTPSPPPQREAIPTLSEWGLIAMAGVLGIIGLLAIRRRKVTA